MSLSLNQKQKTYRLTTFLKSHEFGAFISTSLGLAAVGFLGLALAPNFTPEDTYAEGSASKLNVNIAPTAAIAMEYYNPSTSTYVSSDTLDIELSPSTFKTGALRVTASTNSPTGMKLSMNDSDSNNALIEQGDSQSSPAKPYISSITSNTTIADATDSGNAFNDNTWGYAFADTTVGSSAAPAVPLTYSQIPTTETLLRETETLGDNAYILTAAVRAGRDMAAGIYKDQLTFTVIANPLPEPAPEFFTTEYMQDFNQTICATVETPSASLTAVTASDGSDYDGSATKVPSTTIKDKRDEQEYTIRKLADGNCWMTENLRFGAEPDTSTTPASAPTARPWNSTTDPDLTDTTTTNNINNLTTARISNASNCGSNFSDSTTNYQTPSICTYQANTKATYDGKTPYGVLYNYCAATGGTVCNSDSMSTDVTGSVCPKGWKLPGMTASATGSGATTDGSVKSYNNLANSYGYGNTSAGLTGMVADSTSGLINLVRAGNASGGSLSNRSASDYGSYWASTKYTSSNSAYFLYLKNISDLGIYVRRSDNSRCNGYSVRCVSASS